MIERYTPRGRHGKSLGMSDRLLAMKESPEGGYVTYDDHKAEIAELVEGITKMKCTCLPYAYRTGEGICQRCRLLKRIEDKE